MSIGKRLGYLSAAPRVSTRPEAELGGPRSHILGVIHAFEALGWQVKPFIVGDHVPRNWVVKGSEQSMRRSRLKVLLADLMRIGMGRVNGRRAWREMGSEVDWVYERFAAFQALGGHFNRRGIFWILETNAPLFLESKHDRRTMVLSSLAGYLEAKAYKDCDLLICISEELKQIIIEKMDIAPGKIFVMPNGVDAAFFDPGQYHAQRQFDGFTIGFVGGMAEWQGLNSLLKAVSCLRADGADINITFIGDGPEKATLEKQAKESGLGKHIRFVGQVAREDVPALIAGFDIGYSGQIPLKLGRMYLSPLKLYEYMAMAKPVIASDFEDSRRVVKNRETGFLFSAGDERQLCDAILSAYESRHRLEEMGQKARASIIREHSWQTRVTSLIDLATAGNE